MKILKCSLTLALAIGVVAAATSSAGENTPPNRFLGALTVATAAELPAKAAELVTQADAKNLQPTTVEVVKAAVGLNPAAAPAIVGSIAQSTPGMAAIASSTAVALVPQQAAAIARAAVAAAPAKAGSIVEAICRALPAAYQTVATAVAEVVPGAGKEILAGIAAAIPELKDAINQTLASYHGDVPSVSTILMQVVQSASSASTTTLSSGSPASPSLPRGPSVGPPLVPPSAPTTVLDPGTGGQVPTGGPRGYSSP